MSQRHCCRACGAVEGELVLDLGMQPLANNLLRPEDLAHEEPRFPLRVFVCPRCRLLQITDLVPPVQLFSEYLYFSSFSDAMLQHARSSAGRYIRDYKLDASSHVVEIASNDGYLLQYFLEEGVPCLGIEPAANIARVARNKGIDTIEEFFGRELGTRLAHERGPADLILGNNVFAHAPDINDFVAGLRAFLAPGGRIILEFPYAMDLVGGTEFDTIYHEHVFYFFLTPLVPLFRRHGLEIFSVERLPIHGGSLRIFAGEPDAHPADGSVTAMLDAELRDGIATREFYAGFARQVAAIRKKLVGLLRDHRRQGRRIAAYGASAKGSTLLNYCELGPETIEFVADRSGYKQGRLTPGTHLPIVAPDQLIARQPDLTLLLTWNFADEILGQQQAYRDAGGRFVIPIPGVQIV